jgi:hypothetical protein
MKTSKIRLNKNEWDFSNVPNSEIRDCFHYEYSREADRSLWHLFWKRYDILCDFSGDGIVNQKKQKITFEEMENGLVYPFFQDLALGEINRKYKAPRSWQQLTVAQKSAASLIVNREVGKSNGSNPIILQHWVHIENFAGEARCELVNGNAFLMPNIGSVFIGLTGNATVAMTLDLKKFRDAELIREFKNLLKRLRVGITAAKLPMSDSAFSGPGKKGTKLKAFRANLENLGIVRIRHALRLDDAIILLERAKVNLWKFDDDRNEQREKINTRREHALKIFRSLFPQLGQNSEPNNWATKV